MFYVLLLEQDSTKKTREFSVLNCDPGDDKEYEVEAIWGSAVYAKKTDRYLLGLYYLVI